MIKFPDNLAEIVFGGLHKGEYPGAFPPKVEKIIKHLAHMPSYETDSVLHLFSGSSAIGDIRVDINPDSNATHKMDVFAFLKSAEAERPWEWVIGDPDYCDEQVKRLGRSGFSSQKVFADWRQERVLSDFMARWAKNILWLDRRMPIFNKVFTRKKVWLIYQGGWRNVRVLQLLVRREPPLESFVQGVT